MSTLLLDTNILVHYVRRDAVWTKVRSRYQPLMASPTPLISVVTTGELRSLAYQWNWSLANRSQMEFILGYFKVVTIHDAAIVEAYSIIDSYFQIHGQVFGKNDLWIAATAMELQVPLITQDHAMLGLPNIETILV